MHKSGFAAVDRRMHLMDLDEGVELNYVGGPIKITGDETIHDASSILDEVQSSMLALAKAFRVTGNDHVADRLSDFVQSIQDANDIAQAVVSKLWSDRLKDSKGIASGLFKAVMSGCLSNAKTPEEKATVENIQQTIDLCTSLDQGLPG